MKQSEPAPENQAVLAKQNESIASLCGNKIVATLSQQLSRSHFIEIMPLKKLQEASQLFL